MEKFDFVQYHVTGRDKLQDELHVHNDSYEIMQITEGKGFFVIGGNPYQIYPGAVYFTNAIHLHCSRPQGNVPYVRSKLAVNASYFDQVMELLKLSDVTRSLFGVNGGCCIQLPQNKAEMIDRNFKKMSEYYEQKTSESHARIILLLVDVLLTCAAEAPLQKAETQIRNSLLSRTINYINLNISNELTIDIIARENFVSKYYLCRMFKKSFGVSIMKYILSQRLALSKELLINSDTRSSDIAMKTGFSSFSYFCRAFKQQEGVSPSKYRALHKK